MLILSQKMVGHKLEKWIILKSLKSLKSLSLLMSVAVQRRRTRENIFQIYQSRAKVVISARCFDNVLIQRVGYHFKIVIFCILLFIHLQNV